MSSAIQARWNPDSGFIIAADVGEPRAVAADVDPHRVVPFRLPREVARQDHAGAQVDRPAVEVAEEPRADLEILDQFGLGRQRFLGHGSRQLQADGAAGRRVEPDGRHGAVQVSGCIGEVQVGVRCKRAWTA